MEQLQAIPAPEVPARSDPAANHAAIGCRAPISDLVLDRDHKNQFGKIRPVFDRVDAFGTHHPHPDPPPSRGREYK